MIIITIGNLLIIVQKYGNNAFHAPHHQYQVITLIINTDNKYSRTLYFPIDISKHD